MSIHDHVLPVPGFWIDKYPATNTEYASFLASSKYQPADRTNWLSFWNHTHTAVPTPPAGGDWKPVTGIGLAEARAYCRHYGKRLPSEIEWAYAAQGGDGRAYPWGNIEDASRFPSPAVATMTNPIPDDVNAHPRGCSMFGVCDLLGNVWQYTTEFRDAHSRAVILRGSSRYAPAAYAAENYYFGPALNLSHHGRYLLMDDSFERAATIGFRCACNV
jgi:iron(II)-dependent oxidoreductase